MKSLLSRLRLCARRRGVEVMVVSPHLRDAGPAARGRQLADVSCRTRLPEISSDAAEG
jgi:hypothetical protein